MPQRVKQVRPGHATRQDGIIARNLGVAVERFQHQVLGFLLQDLAL